MKKRSTKKEIEKSNTKNKLAKIVAAPFSAKAAVEIAMDRANADARIKIIEANLIVKYRLLHKKKGD